MNEKEFTEQDLKSIDAKHELRSRDKRVTQQPRTPMPDANPTTPTVEQVFSLLNNMPDEELPANLLKNTLKYIDSHSHRDAHPEKSDLQRDTQADKRPPLHG